MPPSDALVEVDPPLTIADVPRLEGIENLFRSAQHQNQEWVGLCLLRTAIPESYTIYREPDSVSLAKEAEECMARAERTLRSGSCVMNTWGESRELFLEGGGLYQKAGLGTEAGKAYKRAAECAMKLRSQCESASDLVKAATCLQQVEPHEAVECLQQAIAIHASVGRGNRVAKYEKQIATIYETLWLASRTDEDLEASLQHYTSAVEHYDVKANPSVKTERNFCLSKMGGFLALLGRYQEAVRIFELLCTGLTAEKVKAEGLFRSMLCHLVQITVENRLQGIEQSELAFDQYSDAEPQFHSGKEYELIRSLIHAIKRQDLTGFRDAVDDYMAYRTPDFWRDRMLAIAEDNLVKVLHSVINMKVPTVGEILPPSS